MELNEINKLAQSLPEESQEAILKLIDLKTNNDMKEVVQSIKYVGDSTYRAIEDLKRSTDTAIENLEKNTERNFKIIYWLFGILTTAMIALKIFS